MVKRSEVLLSFEQAYQTVQPNQNHMISTICCQKPKRRRHICATVSIRIKRAGGQFHKHEPLQTLITATPTWIKKGFRPERIALRQLFRNLPMEARAYSAAQSCRTTD